MDYFIIDEYPDHSCCPDSFCTVIVIIHILAVVLMFIIRIMLINDKYTQNTDEL